MAIRYTIINDENEFVEELIENGLISLKNKGRISKYNIYDKSNKHWNVKIENKGNSLYFIEFHLSTNVITEQVHIKVQSKEEKEEYDITLEDIKRDVKKYFLKEWTGSRCYWIDDYQVIQLSERLYPKINKAENLLRTFINIVMDSNYGASWWDLYIPYKIKNKYASRSTYLKRNIDTFNDVVDNLLSIDVDDLMKILKLEVKEWFPQASEAIEIAINKSDQNKLMVLLREQMNVSKDLWEEVFGKYFDEKFLNDWKNFCADRNHIAHNKPIDYNAFKKINNNVDTIIAAIERAKNKFEDSLEENINNETRFKRDNECKYNNYNNTDYYESYESLEHERMEAEANISILKEPQILEEFEIAIGEICDEIENKYYFRQDLIIESDILEDAECMPLKITSKINDEIIQLKVIPLINDSPGDTSELEIQVIVGDEIAYKHYMEYINGEAEYNYDQGYYMPLTENQLVVLNQDELYEVLDEKINEFFPNLLKEAKCINESTIRDGSSRLTLEEPCEECGEEGVSIDNSFFEYGRCVNCNCLHSISECIRCEELFIGTGDFCTACEEYIEKA